MTTLGYPANTQTSDLSKHRGGAQVETRGPAPHGSANQRRWASPNEAVRPVLPLRVVACSRCGHRLDPRLAPLGEHLPSERDLLCKP